MDAEVPSLDPPRLPANITTMIFQSMSLRDRFTCALVCKAWAQEAAAATHLVLRDVQDLSCLQSWLEKHGEHVQVLQLHQCPDSAVLTDQCPDSAVLTALPCPQLKDLLLWGSPWGGLSIDSSVWRDITTATKLTSVSLGEVQTASRHADVVSALAALPGLEQLTWNSVTCGQQWWLHDRMPLHKLTKLSALQLCFVGAAGDLEDLGLLTRLQDLSLVHVSSASEWIAAGCPGLQELNALTRLKVTDYFHDIPSSVCQLTALQQLDVSGVSQTGLNKLSPLTGLTHLCVRDLHPGPVDAPLQLPGLQHLEVQFLMDTVPMSGLGSCTQLLDLALSNVDLIAGLGPDSMLLPTTLQRLEMHNCWVSAPDDDTVPGSWQQVFSGPERLPHLTSLKMIDMDPDLQHADMECVVACCSNLKLLFLEPLRNSFTSALTRLPGLTSFTLGQVL